MMKTLGEGWWNVFVYNVRRRIRSLIFGRPLATSVQHEHKLPIYLALPVFASDALSSVAYATQEILLQFKHGGLVSLFTLQSLGWISVAIALLLVIVATSYIQAIHLYPSGGGSYSVSRDNLGVLPGLTAASALIIDYILTVSVSVSSGVENLASAVPYFHREIEVFRFIGIHTPISLTVLLAVVLVLFITLINLRGTRESGWLFALPAYSFVTMLLLVIGTTIFRWAVGTAELIEPLPAATTTPMSSLVIGYLILRAFSSGCSALTGVEAVSNGVSAFEPPEAKNAAKTLFILMIMLLVLFLGVSGSAILYHAIPSETQTVISLIAGQAFGDSVLGKILYILTIAATLSVLMIAANTSFAGFPRLLANVAKDGYAPKSFTTLGDRLVHNRGILVLSAISILLIVYFKARTNSLIPMYAVGVFICFTLSQLGMVHRARKLHEKGWQRTVFINSAGAFITGIVAIIQAISKFMQGAVMVVLLLPVMIAIFYLIKRHYDWFDRTMTVHDYDYNPLSEPVEPLTVLVLVSSDIHRGILEGLECGRAIAEGHPNSVLRAVHIEMDPEKTPRLKAKWAKLVEPYLGQKIKLDIIPSPYRWLVEPILDYLDWADLERTGDRVIVVLPEFETGSWLTQLLHNFTARRLRSTLLNRPHVTVVSSRYFMKPMAWRIGRGGLVY